MTAPRLEIDLKKIRCNTHKMVESLADRGISVTGVTKATLGSPQIAGALLQAGVHAIGDSRIENIEAMRRARVPATMTLIRSPMLSQIDRVVEHADISFNTELDIISKLSYAAGTQRLIHGVVLMVELGDLREGILPHNLEDTVRETLSFQHIVLKGIGANLACRSGVSPDSKNMTELSELACSIEATFGLHLDIISGGNSANLDWALNCTDTGRINDLRLGESILLGREPLNRLPINGLHTDAFAIVAEVIESKIKPSLPWGKIAQSAFCKKPPITDTDSGHILQAILAIGHQDTDPSGLQSPPGIKILGSSSDHLVVNTANHNAPVGTEITFQPNYSALVRSMTSPFVAKVVKAVPLS